jgi:two-component system, NarL family, sensor histidine kinase DegS
LARELHDGVLQDLCALARDLKAFAHDPAAIVHQQETLETYANEAVTTLRTICHNLRPPFLTNSLPLTLRALVERLDGRTDAIISFKTNVDALELAEETTIAIYRIAQEALTNAIQHAQASEILVRLTQYPDTLRLTIHDDGCGIMGSTAHTNRNRDNHNLDHFVAEGHFGLAGMRERAKMIGATLDIHSAKEYGTAVILHLPSTPTPQRSLISSSHA